MRVDGHSPSSSLSLHLDPRQARMVVTAELGVSMGDDAAVYLCVVLQRTIERLVAGALTSCGKPELRTKYGGTGRDVQPGADVQPRHLQDYIRTDKDMWVLFNSAFAFQVILSVFLDHATEMCFRRLGLPVHSKEALASCEYYATVVDGLKQKKSAHLPSNKHNNTGAPAGCDASSNPPLENLSVATPAQLSRVAARVNPLCSVSPKACLMTEALIHEIFMALCEGVLRSRPDTRVITIVDLDGGIRDVFPEGLAVEATRAGKEAMSTLSGEPLAPLADGEVADDHVRLCVRRLQGTRTLLKKTFRVSPGSLLFAVFTKACERLRIKETSVIFVHDGTVLSGRRQAGTLVCGATTRRRTVQVFAVCKRAWACKQRAAARRGLLLGNGEPFDATEQARKRFTNVSGANHGEKPWRQKHMPSPFGPRVRVAAPAASKGLHITHHQPLVPIQPPPQNVFHSLPPGLETQGGGEEAGGVPKPPPPRLARRWIATPAEGTKLDLGRLENARAFVPLRQRTRGFKTGLLGSVSTGALVGSSGGRCGDGGGAGGAVVSPRIERTVRRLSAMEACLRNLEDSMKELQSGDLNGRPSGISSIAMSAITSQLEVAYNLSSLCRHVISSADEDGQQFADEKITKDSRNRTAEGGMGNDPSTNQGQLRGGEAQEDTTSFLTEVPTKPRSVPASSSTLSQPRHPPAEAPGGLAPEREAVDPQGHAQVQDQVSAWQAPRPERLPAGAVDAHSEERTLVAGPVEDKSSEFVPSRHYPGGVPMQQQFSSGSGHVKSREQRRASSKATLETLHEGGVENDGGGDRFQAPRTEGSPAGAGNARSEERVEASPVDGGRNRVVPPRQKLGGASSQQRLSSGSGRDDRWESSHELRCALHEGGIENGGKGSGHRVEPAASQSRGYAGQALGEEDTVAEDIASSSWSSMISQGQRALEDECPEEEAAHAAEEAPSSWNYMRSIGRSGREGEHPSAIAEEEPHAWSGYVSELQPSTPPHAMPVEENRDVNDSTGEGARTSLFSGGDAGDNGRKSGGSNLPKHSAVALAGDGHTSVEGGKRTAAVDREQTRLPDSNAQEQRWPQNRGHGLSEGGVVEANGASERVQGATRRGGVKVDTDENGQNGAPSGTTLLNPGGSKGGNVHVDPGGGKPVTTAEGAGGELGRNSMRLPSSILAPNAQAEADPYEDGDWEDVGDEKDGGLDGGNWSSWLGAAGGG